MSWDEFVVKKGLLTSTGVLFFPEKTPELMTITSGKINTILFTWYLSPSVHSMTDVILFFSALIFPLNPMPKEDIFYAP